MPPGVAPGSSCAQSTDHWCCSVAQSSYRVAANSATIATYWSNLAARLDMGAPANGSSPASQQAAPADSQRSAAVKKLSKQASRSFTCALQAPYAGILAIKPCDLKTSSDQHAAPADKLRIGSGALTELCSRMGVAPIRSGPRRKEVVEVASGPGGQHQRQAGDVPG